MDDESELDRLLDEPERPPRAPKPAPGGAFGTALLLLFFALPFLCWALLPFLGLDDHRYTAALVALTPCAVPVGVVLALLALALRRWVMGLCLGVVTALLVVWVAPRAIPDGGDMSGFPLRVLSSNRYLGQGDAQQLVALVRSERVDVLSLQELTPHQVRELDRAGLGQVLANRDFWPGPGGAGTGLASRYPLHPLGLVPPTSMHMPSDRLDLPGGRHVDVVAVHPQIPVGPESVGRWQREIGALPPPLGGRGEVPRVLAGDFNATLDHTPLRALLGRGYRDAAAATGNGLTPTWPMNAPGPPFAALDHVLTADTLGVGDFETFDLGGTDHRAVLAQVQVR